MRFADLEAVTVDGFGTLIELESPVQRLVEALAIRGVQRPPGEVARAFASEVAHYRPRAHLARNRAGLARLRRDCVQVFLDALDAPLEPDEFVEPFLDALVFRPVGSAVKALGILRDHELKLAVVSNWDCSLPERLAALGLAQRFDAIVSSAQAGAPKPEPRAFELALERLGASPERALHVGDEDIDERGAAAAGLHFAPAPLATAVAALE
jgi:HAD superfamily hydrolase (TIGR01509 family)